MLHYRAREQKQHRTKRVLSKQTRIEKLVRMNATEKEAGSVMNLIGGISYKPVPVYSSV